ncbi:MAG: hypothetical protein WCJ56_06585 [bacterium]
MKDIFHIEEALYTGVHNRYIDGMRIYDENEAEGMEDPMITFYRAMVKTYPCAAHIGIMPLEKRNPKEAFAPLREGEDYFLTSLNSHSHGALWVEKADPGGCFFPHFSESFFDIKDDDGESLFDYLLLYDQPLFYVNVDEAALAQIKELYAHPPLLDIFDAKKLASENEVREMWWAFRNRWWEEITHIAPLGVWGGYDNSAINVCSEDPDNFKLIDLPLEMTSTAIRSTPWFQANHD